MIASLEDDVGNDPLSPYLKEIGQYPLLSSEEEFILAKQKQDSEDETVRSSARDKLINSNLRYVVRVASFYNWSRVSMLDRIQEGNIGLMEAVRRFDYTIGTRLSTYANFWIRRAIQYALKQRRYRDHVFLEDVHPNFEFGVEDGDMLDKESRKMAVLKSLDELEEERDNRESLVIKMKFGLFGFQNHHYPEIAEFLGISRERARQIKELAFESLSYKLREYSPVC